MYSSLTKATIKQERPINAMKLDKYVLNIIFFIINPFTIKLTINLYVLSLIIKPNTYYTLGFVLGDNLFFKSIKTIINISIITSQYILSS